MCSRIHEQGRCAVAHVVAALGAPIWMPTPCMPDWRWLLDRRDTPWYPTMRLFRQSKLNDWETVFATLAEELRSRVAVSV